LPAEVARVVRQGSSHRLTFLINHNAAPAMLPAPPSGCDLISEKPIGGPLTLAPNAVAVNHSCDMP
jgi:hypothetical protein